MSRQRSGVARTHAANVLSTKGDPCVPEASSAIRAGVIKRTWPRILVSSRPRHPRGGCEVPMIRVAIAEDHTLVREALRHLLTQSGRVQVAGEATNGREAVELVQRIRPDVLLLDISMPEKDGLQASME